MHFLFPKYLCYIIVAFIDIYCIVIHSLGEIMALEGIQIGHYRLKRLVGSGGMGEVYLAEDTRIPRHVAVKVVRNEASPYPNVQSRKDATLLFEREMKAIAALDHPNILPLFDFGEETLNTVTLTYMVMPFRSEGSLIDWLHREGDTGTLRLQEVVHFVSQAADALQHAHNRHLMHLDVKPSNFLIRYREDHPHLPDVLLTDFGIARFNAATVTTSQTIRGTPAYMAPEQWAGVPVAATDQYALGIMTYQLLTGTSPFQGNMQQVMYQHLQKQPQPLSAFNRDIPAAIDTVILRALAKNPEDRFPSIQAFAQALNQAPHNMFQPYATQTSQEAIPTVLTNSNKIIFTSPASNEVTLAASDSPPAVNQDSTFRNDYRREVSPARGVLSNQPQKTFRGRSILIIILVFLLVMIGSIGVLFYMARSAPSSTTSSTQSSGTNSTYPGVAGQYHGNIDNTLVNIRTTMSLSINQNRGGINGTFTVGPELLGSGLFTGVVDTVGNIQFKVHNAQLSEPLFFSGTVQSGGSISGTYCSVNEQNQCDPNAGRGTWNVTRSSS
jgi:serine/threonine protein kinase